MDGRTDGHPQVGHAGQRIRGGKNSQRAFSRCLSASTVKGMMRIAEAGGCALAIADLCLFMDGNGAYPIGVTCHFSVSK